MKNGFVIRESTTCVDPANYSEEIGKQICLGRIENKIWEYLGFLLQEQVSQDIVIIANKRYQILLEEEEKLCKILNNE